MHVSNRVPVTARCVQRLAEFDTPTICNAIEMFDVRPRNRGFTDGRIRAAFRGLPPMVGFASTARMCSNDTAPGKDAYACLERQLENVSKLAGPPVVVYQDVEEPAVGATVGEVMCNVYRAAGAAGLITSGAARDLSQIEALSFPLFMGATIASHAFCRTIDVGVPVEVGGLQVSPGDLLHGDENGVVSIPHELMSEIPDVAQEYAAAERIVVEFCQTEAKKNAAELIERRHAMSEALAILKRRVMGRRVDPR
jgi:4-hydroxy-4-methyl-2-oxoglutarate aldolase